MSELVDFNNLFYGKYPHKYKGLYSISERLLGKHTFDTTLAFKLLESAAKERDYGFIDRWANSVCHMLKLQHKSVLQQIVDVWIKDKKKSICSPLNLILIKLNYSEELNDK